MSRPLKTKPHDNFTIDEFTTPCSFFATKKMNLDEIIALMDDEGIRHIPVIEYGKAVGIITEGDVRLFRGSPLIRKLKAEDVMVQRPFMVKDSTLMKDVTLEMSKQKFGSALVTNEEGDITGIFTTTDALNALVEILRA